MLTKSFRPAVQRENYEKNAKNSTAITAYEPFLDATTSPAGTWPERGRRLRLGMGARPAGRRN